MRQVVGGEEVVTGRGALAAPVKPARGWLRLATGILIYVEEARILGHKLVLLLHRDWPEAVLDDADGKQQHWWIDEWRTRPALRPTIEWMTRQLRQALREVGLARAANEARCIFTMRDDIDPPRAAGLLPASAWECELACGAAPASVVEDFLRPRWVKPDPGHAHRLELLQADDERTVLQAADAAGLMERWRCRPVELAGEPSRQRWDFLAPRLERATLHPHLATVRLEWLEWLAVEHIRWQDTLSLAALHEVVHLTVAEKLEAVLQVTQALAALHDLGIVHQQVDAERVLMADDGAWLHDLALPLDRDFQADALPAQDITALGSLAVTLFAPCAAALPEVLQAFLGQCRRGETGSLAAPLFEERLRRCVELPEPADWRPTAVADTEPDALLVPGEQVGDYRVVRHLKTGGFAQVYEAMHDLQALHCVLKVYHASAGTDDLREEFRLLRSLHHRHIGRVWWNGRLPDGRPYLVLEYLEGEDLSRFAWGDGQLSLATLRQIGLEILSALDYLHDPLARDGASQGRALCHRDVKPGNILLVPGRGAVLIDFNVARVAGRQDGFTGTHRYTPPEVIEGRRAWDPSCDLFGLGVTLYELACRRFPFEGDAPSLEKPPRPPEAPPGQPALPEAWRSFLRKAVQPSASRRFTAASRMAAQLRALPETADKAAPTATAGDPIATLLTEWAAGATWAVDRLHVAGSLEEWLATCGDGAIVVTGPMGSGRRTLLRYLSRRCPSHRAINAVGSPERLELLTGAEGPVMLACAEDDAPAAMARGGDNDLLINLGRRDLLVGCEGAPPMAARLLEKVVELARDAASTISGGLLTANLAALSDPLIRERLLGALRRSFWSSRESLTIGRLVGELVRMLGADVADQPLAMLERAWWQGWGDAASPSTLASRELAMQLRYLPVDRLPALRGSPWAELLQQRWCGATTTEERRQVARWISCWLAMEGEPGGVFEDRRIADFTRLLRGDPELLDAATRMLRSFAGESKSRIELARPEDPWAEPAPAAMIVRPGAQAPIVLTLPLYEWLCDTAPNSATVDALDLWEVKP